MPLASSRLSPRAPRLAAMLPALLVLAACAEPTPPDAPPPMPAAPPVVEDGWHATYRTTKVFDAPLAPLLAWLEKGNEIVAAMEETDRIKKPVEIKVVEGTWPNPGAVRWLKFSDGHYTYERVLENDLPRKFSYQVFGLTSGAGQHVTYARGQQEWRTLPDGRSELTWTYQLRPNSIIKRPFLSSFINSDMKPFMEGALDRTVAKARVELAGVGAKTGA